MPVTMRKHPAFSDTALDTAAAPQPCRNLAVNALIECPPLFLGIPPPTIRGHENVVT